MHNYTVKTGRGLESCPGARAVREAVFEGEQGFRDEFDDIDGTALFAAVYDGDRAIATGRTFPKEGDPETYVFGRICVLSAYRGRGIGNTVMEALEQLARGAGARCGYLSAQVQARGFYEKLGYAAHGDVYLDEHCPHIAMDKGL